MAPLGIIAGLGDLPVQVAAAATERGQGVYVLRLKGFEEPALEAYPGEVAGIAQLGKAFKAFRAAGCQQICFAGIVKRLSIDTEPFPQSVPTRIIKRQTGGVNSGSRG